MIWELQIAAASTEAMTELVLRLSLGDQIPTTIAQMELLQPLVPGCGVRECPYEIRVIPPFRYHLSRLRKPILASGRRLVVEITGPIIGSLQIDIWLIVSSVPMEVPDWLVSR
ncbi:hypothetical protein ES705_47225 [subsurface metagenome]